MLPVSDSELLDSLRTLDDRTLLLVGANNIRSRKAAREAGNRPLATLHGFIGVLIDRALLERANRDPRVIAHLERNNDSQSSGSSQPGWA